MLGPIGPRSGNIRRHQSKRSDSNAGNLRGDSNAWLTNKWDTKVRQQPSDLQSLWPRSTAPQGWQGKIMLKCFKIELRRGVADQGSPRAFHRGVKKFKPIDSGAHRTHQR